MRLLRAGILGANGAGKSTLMKVLAGVDSAFEGDVVVQKGLRIGYLPQEPPLNDGATVWDNIAPALAPMQAKLAAFEEVSLAMGSPDADMDALMGRMTSLQEEIDAANGWELERTAERAMDALRCPPRDAQVAVLSGGERRRVAICRLLLERPEMLLVRRVWRARMPCCGLTHAALAALHACSTFTPAAGAHPRMQCSMHACLAHFALLGAPRMRVCVLCWTDSLACWHVALPLDLSSFRMVRFTALPAFPVTLSELTAVLTSLQPPRADEPPGRCVRQLAGALPR